MQILSILPNIPFFPCRRRSLLSRRLRACALLAPASIFAPLFFPGCAGVPSESTPPLSVGTYNDAAPNPLFVQTADPDYLWNAVVDVVDNYFEIEFETPIRVFERETENGERFTSRAEGRIDTKPTIAAGVLEPWRKNSVACEDRWLATFQTIRRSAVVRVVPDAAGYLIYLSVYNEIEDLKTPMGATIGVQSKLHRRFFATNATGGRTRRVARLDSDRSRRPPRKTYARRNRLATRQSADAFTSIAPADSLTLTLKLTLKINAVFFARVSKTSREEKTVRFYF